MFRDPGEHARPDFLFIVKRPNVVRKLGIPVAKFDMRTALRND